MDIHRKIQIVLAVILGLCIARSARLREAFKALPFLHKIGSIMVLFWVLTLMVLHLSGCVDILSLRFNPL